MMALRAPESYLALVEMVKGGLGLATLPRQLVREALARGELVELDLAAYPYTDWLVSVDLVWAKSARPQGRAEQWLRQRFRDTTEFEVDRRGQHATR
ncbi:LysR family transcriptional regulator (fragment) [Cupriavidus taiwanensis]|uniref:LysR family transcriptional regulator n=2 Tax=Cupriavidus taiwanensis TaxID=164546 RepID=A0A375GZT3_9BURK